MKKLVKIVLSIGLMLALTFCAVSCTFVAKTPTKKSDVFNGTVQDVDINYGEETGRTKLDLVDAVEVVEKSVVAVQTEYGLGAGVITDIKMGEEDKNVYVITCFHVISKMGNITLYLPDDNCEYYNDAYTYTGVVGGTNLNDKAVTLVGGDKDSDLAVLKIDLNKPTVAGSKLSESDICKAVIAPDSYNARKGETVFAVGNPTGHLPGSVADGVVSYLERETSVDEVGNMLLMQITVTTNPGNSGGGLFNLYGELIGITNAGNTNYEAVNFAIPLYTSLKGVEGKIDNGIINIVSQLMGTATEDNYGCVVGRREKLGFTVTTTDGSDIYVLSVVADSQSDGKLKDYNENTINYNMDIITGLKINDGGKITFKSTASKTAYQQFTDAMDTLSIGDEITLYVTRQTRTGYVGKIGSTDMEVKLHINQFRFCDTGIYD